MKNKNWSINGLVFMLITAMLLIFGCSGGGGGTNSPTVTVSETPIPTVAPLAVDLDDTIRNAYSEQTVSLSSHISSHQGNVAYTWSQIGGTKVSLKDTDKAVATFVAPQVISNHELLSFKLVVSDEKNQVSKKIAITIEPKQNIIVNVATQERKVFAGKTASLHAVCSGAKSPVYSWSQIAPDAPVMQLSNPTSDSPTFTVPDTAGMSYDFQVTCTDAATGMHTSAKTRVKVVANTVNAIQPLNVQPPSFQPHTPGQTAVLSVGVNSGDHSYKYKWKQTGGTAVTLTNSNGPTPTFTVPAVSTATALTFEATVSDNSGRVSTVVAQVPVAPQTTPSTPAIIDEMKPTTNATVGESIALTTTLSSPVWTQTLGTIATTNGAQTKVLNVTVPNITANAEVILFQASGTNAGGSTVRETWPIAVHRPQSTPAPVTAPVPVIPTMQVPALMVIAETKPTRKATVGDSITLTTKIKSPKWTQTLGTAASMSGTKTRVLNVTVPNITANAEVIMFQASGTNTNGNTVRETWPVAVTRPPTIPAPATQPAPVTPVIHAPTAIAVITEMKATTNVYAGDSITLTTALSSPKWTQAVGPAATMSGAQTQVLSVTVPNITTNAEVMLFQASGTNTNGSPVRETWPVAVYRPSSTPAPVTPPTPVTPVIQAPATQLTLHAVGGAQVDADEGQYGVILAVQASGGTGNYTYSWTCDNTNGLCTNVSMYNKTSNNLNIDIPSVSNDTTVLKFTATVTDGAQTATVSKLVRVHDRSASFSAGTLSPLSVKSGALITLTQPIPSGGVAPYGFSVVQTAGTSVGTLSGSTPGFPVPILASGSSNAQLTFRYTVTDAAGNTGTVDQNITVIAPAAPLAAKLTGPVLADQGKVISLNTNVNGGTAPYTYAYTVTGGTLTIQATDNPSVTLPTIAAGGSDKQFNITVTVTDSTGKTATAGPLVLTVHAPAVLTATVADGGSVNAGSSITLNTPSIQGGVPPYSYTITQSFGQSVGALTGTNPVFTAPNPVPGIEEQLSFDYTITDSAGNTVLVTENITIPAPVPAFTITTTGVPATAPASVYYGPNSPSNALQTAALQIVPGGGVPGYTYSYRAFVLWRAFGPRPLYLGAPASHYTGALSVDATDPSKATITWPGLDWSRVFLDVSARDSMGQVGAKRYEIPLEVAHGSYTPVSYGADSARQWAADNGLSYPNYNDDGTCTDTYGPTCDLDFGAGMCGESFTIEMCRGYCGQCPNPTTP